MIAIVIPGNPIPLKRHRPSAKGGYYDPSSTDKKQIWLQIARFRPKKPLEGNIYLKVIFHFKRPKNHYRTGKYAHLLKDAYKDVNYNKSRPDIDNCLKLLADVTQGKNRFILDDSQICMLQAEKVYSNNARTEVIIQEVP